MSLTDLWPLLGLRVRTPAIELFVPQADDLAAVAELAARGVYDPVNHFVPRTPVAGWTGTPSPEAERAFLRYYWAALADWRPDRWNLVLAAAAAGRIVGVQEIGAQCFSVTRTVSTGSWVGRDEQGHGHGKAMREAVLWLAFVVLDAERADSAAWADNGPSLGVSRSLGYRPNGTTTRAADGRRVEQVNLTLAREDWRPPEAGFEVVGMSDEVAGLLGSSPG